MSAFVANFPGLLTRLPAKAGPRQPEVLILRAHRPMAVDTPVREPGSGAETRPGREGLKGTLTLRRGPGNPGA